ncbi:hypothetical protein [Nitrosomonas sp. Nm34]|uniref:hypothetical protein n=1 Tax=Nitrosomonas sp. Nm34 TaxID=1881055 RepID=UPI0008E5345D|nr:hypothetical protein [Nitrosomonas sp. Nm34]SFI57018.1 hypothetical protein SAMN05428978_101756 [Nitrosomonas sp. Nm34]
MKYNFYKINERQAAITSELLEKVLLIFWHSGIALYSDGRLSTKPAEGVTERINNVLLSHQHKGHTVTLGNANKFAEHETIASELEAAI